MPLNNGKTHTGQSKNPTGRNSHLPTKLTDHQEMKSAGSCVRRTSNTWKANNNSAGNPGCWWVSGPFLGEKPVIGLHEQTKLVPSENDSVPGYVLKHIQTGATHCNSAQLSYCRWEKTIWHHLYETWDADSPAKNNNRYGFKHGVISWCEMDCVQTNVKPALKESPASCSSTWARNLGKRSHASCEPSGRVGEKLNIECWGIGLSGVPTFRKRWACETCRLSSTLGVYL